MDSGRWNRSPLPPGMPTTQMLMKDLLDSPCRLGSDSRYSLFGNRGPHSGFREPPSHPMRPPNIGYHPSYKSYSGSHSGPQWNDPDTSGINKRMHSTHPEMHRNIMRPHGNQVQYEGNRYYNSTRASASNMGSQQIADYGHSSQSRPAYCTEGIPSMDDVLKTSEELKYLLEEESIVPSSCRGNEAQLSKDGLTQLLLLEVLKKINKTEESERQSAPSRYDGPHSSQSASFWGKVSKELQADQSKFKTDLGEMLHSKEITENKGRKGDGQKSLLPEVIEVKNKYLDKEKLPAAYRNKSPEPHGRPPLKNRSRSRSPRRYRSGSPLRYRTKSSRDTPPKRYRSPFRNMSRNRDRKYRSKSPTSYRMHSSTGYRSRSPTGHRSRSPTGYRSRSPTGYRSQPPTGNRNSLPLETVNPPREIIKTLSSHQLIGALHLVSNAIELSGTPYLLSIMQNNIPVYLRSMSPHLKTAMLTQGFELILDVVNSMHEQNWRDIIWHLITFAVENNQNQEIYIEARAHDDELDIRYAKPFELAEYIRGSNAIIAFIPPEVQAEREKASKKKKKKKKKKENQQFLPETRPQSSALLNVLNERFAPVSNRHVDRKSIHQRLGEKVVCEDVVDVTPHIYDRLGGRGKDDVPVIDIE